MALVKVSANLDVERAKIKATRKEYLDKMETHTTHAQHSLDLHMMLGEKKVQLNGREWDLGLHDAALVEALSQGLNPWDKREGLMELVEFQRHLEEAEVECVTDAGWLTMSWRWQAPSWYVCGRRMPLAKVPQTRCAARFLSLHPLAILLLFWLVYSPLLLFVDI
jgi:hypothetical protein